jgi:ribosomal protein S18 acetylase RimI-like enzyme
MECKIREFRHTDYDGAAELWRKTENIGMSSAAAEENIRDFLERNPANSFVAVAEGKIAGTVLGGHDGRRGYLYHLAVDPGYRNSGIGKKMAAAATDRLRSLGIGKCHIMIYKKNAFGRKIWRRLGWELRRDVDIMSLQLSQEHRTDDRTREA